MVFDARKFGAIPVDESAAQPAQTAQQGLAMPQGRGPAPTPAPAPAFDARNLGAIPVEEAPEGPRHDAWSAIPAVGLYRELSEGEAGEAARYLGSGLKGIASHPVYSGDMAVNRFQSAAGESVEGLGRVGRLTRAESLDKMEQALADPEFKAALDRGQDVMSPVTGALIPAETFKLGLKAVRGERDAGAFDRLSMLEEAGQSAQAAAERGLQDVPKDFQDSPSGQIAGGLGSTGVYLGPQGLIMGVGAGANQQAKDYRQSMQEQGKAPTREDELEAASHGGALGSIEFLPVARILGRAKRLAGSGATKKLEDALQTFTGRAKQYGKDVAVSGLEEGAQEFIQGVGQNVIAKDLMSYDEAREYLGPDINEQTYAGMGAGALLSAVLGLPGLRRGRGEADPGSTSPMSEQVDSINDAGSLPGQNEQLAQAQSTNLQTEDGKPATSFTENAAAEPDQAALLQGLGGEKLSEPVAQDGGPGPVQGASTPAMMTNGMRLDLRELGYQDADISKMRPQEAWGIINSQKSAPQQGGADVAVSEELSQTDAKQENTDSTPDTAPADSQTQPAEAPQPPVRRPLPESVAGPLGEIKTKPIGKPVYRETGPEGLDSMLREIGGNTEGAGTAHKTFVADSPDLAIGQGNNKGVLVQMRGDAVSGTPHRKPGTALPGSGQEYQTDAIGEDAIDQVQFLPGQKPGKMAQRLLGRNFSKQKLPDGGLLYTRDGVTPSPIERVVDQQPDTEPLPQAETLQAAPEAPAQAGVSRSVAEETLIRMKSGKPYQSRRAAELASRKRADLKSRDLEAVEVEGGWALRDRVDALGREVEAQPAPQEGVAARGAPVAGSAPEAGGSAQGGERTGREVGGYVPFTEQHKIETVDALVSEGVPRDVADRLADKPQFKAPVDAVTGLLEGRRESADGTTDSESAVSRAIDYVRNTGGSAFWLSFDISNLGGLNEFMGNVQAKANVHYRGVADAVKSALDEIGAQVDGFRTGGDEFGALVVDADAATIEQALDTIRNRVNEYTTEHGLRDFKHPKYPDNPNKRGLGLHSGYAQARESDTAEDLMERADSHMDASKKGEGNVDRDATATASDSQRGDNRERSRDSGRGQAAQDGAVGRGVQPGGRGVDSREARKGNKGSPGDQATGRTVGQQDTPEAPANAGVSRSGGQGKRQWKKDGRKVWRSDDGMIITNESMTVGGNRIKNFFVYENAQERERGNNFATGESYAEAKRLADQGTEQLAAPSTPKQEKSSRESAKPNSLNEGGGGAANARFQVVAINERTGKKTYLSHGEPMTQDEAIRFKKRFSPHPARRIQLEDVASSPAGGLERAASEVDTNPSEAQKEAGNYRKGHARIQGLDISIENPKGSTRSGTAPDGTRWETTMAHHYGDIKRTEGADGDNVDVFIGPDPESESVYIIDQVNEDGSFDEHKAMIGFRNQKAARDGYRANYEKGWRVGPTTKMTMSEFKAWLVNGDTTKPLKDDHFREAKKKVVKPRRPSSKSQETKRQTGKSEESLPQILKVTRSKYLRSMAQSAKIKQGSPGYQEAMAALEEEYEAELDRAHASLSFHQYHALNSANPEGVNRQAWEMLREEHAGEGDAALFSMDPSKPPRSPWQPHFPKAVISLGSKNFQKHPDYRAAKEGDIAAAVRLAKDSLKQGDMVKIKRLAKGVKGNPVLVPVHAEEAVSVNQIPVAATAHIGQELGWDVDESIVQTEKIGRGGGDGFYRLANQPHFVGEVEPGRSYVLLDDTLTQGGTFAALKGHIEANGGNVIGVVAMSGKQYSSLLAPTSDTLEALRKRWPDLEGWWNEQFGYGFGRLTESEARYLARVRVPSLDALRDRVLAAQQARVSRGSPPPTGQGPLTSSTQSPETRPSAGFSASGLQKTLRKAVGQRLADSIEVVQSVSDLPASAGLESLSGHSEAQAFAKSLRDEFPGLKLSLGGRGQNVTLHRIELPRNMRESGIGTQVMERIVEWADAGGVTVALSPTADFGGSKRRLADFYKRFGFTDNAGGNKNYAISETMYRLPDSLPGNAVTETVAAPRDSDAVELNDEGDIGKVETGKPVSFWYRHNTQSATDIWGMPREGDQFSRDKEPSGRYMTIGDKESVSSLAGEAGWETGRITLLNPLVVDVDGWKPALSERYSGKTGKRLSQALIKDGYDGVITVDRGGRHHYISEVLDLQSFDASKARYSTNNRVEGMFDPATGKVYLVADSIPSEDRAAWVAWHELWHRGVRSIDGRRSKLPGSQEGQALNQALNRAGLNKSVKQLADAIMRDRGMAQADRRIAIEEALAELNAADETGDYRAIERRYGVKVPQGMRSGIRGHIDRFLDAVRRVLSKLTGRAPADVSNREVWQIVTGARAGYAGNVERGAGGGLNSVAPEQMALEAEADGAIPEETRFRAMQRKFQDRFNRFTVIQEWLDKGGANLSEQANVYKAEERMHGRVAAKMEDFAEKTVRPLIKKISKAGYSMEDIGRYLHARHAAERNAQIAKINKALPDGGSGMTNAEARAVLAQFDADADFAALADEVRAITKSTRQVLLDSGIVTQEQVDHWDEIYPNYVPLKGGPDAKLTNSAGKGLTVNGKIKRAMGHSKRDDGEWIIENILSDHQMAIMSAEKNRVGQHLLHLIVEGDDDRLFTVGKPEKRGVLRNSKGFALWHKGRVVGAFSTRNEAETALRENQEKTKDGLATYAIEETNDPAVVYMARPQLAENETSVYVNGHAVRIQFHDELLARAWNRLGDERLGWVLEKGRELNAHFSRVYTGYNPEFLLTNMVRDFTTGVANATGEEGVGMAVRSVAAYPGTFAQLIRYAATGRESDLIREFRADGGTTGAAWLGDLERTGKDVQRAYDDALRISQLADVPGKRRKVATALRRIIRPFIGWIEAMNQAGENAYRLAAYKAMRDTGKTRTEAASLAKNVTVNFNRKGEVGASANALYLFFNASMQGSAAIAHAHFKGKHKEQAWAVSAGLMAAGFMYALAQGGADDEEWEGVPEWEKERNIMLKTKDGWAKLPLPYGHGWFWSTGRHMADRFAGKVDNQEAAMKIAASFMDEFTLFGPVLGGGELDVDNMLFLAPTAIQIPGAVAVNKTSMGREVYPENAWDKGMPDSQKFYRGTKGTVFERLTTGMNKATGGDAVKGGAVDVSPETMKYLWRTFTGGSGSFVSDTLNMGVLAAQGVQVSDFESREIPILRRFYRDTDVRDVRNRYYTALNEAREAGDDLARAKRVDRINRDFDMTNIEKYKPDTDEERTLHALGRVGKTAATLLKQKRELQVATMLDEEKPLGKRRLEVKRLEKEEAELMDKVLATMNK